MAIVMVIISFHFTDGKCGHPKFKSNLRRLVHLLDIKMAKEPRQE